MFGEDGAHAGSFPPACHHCCTDLRAAAAGLVTKTSRPVWWKPAGGMSALLRTIRDKPVCCASGNRNPRPKLGGVPNGSLAPVGHTPPAADRLPVADRLPTADTLKAAVHHRRPVAADNRRPVADSSRLVVVNSRAEAADSNLEAAGCWQWRCRRRLRQGRRQKFRRRPDNRNTRPLPERERPETQGRCSQPQRPR
jgi:hypothetical protein